VLDDRIRHGELFKLLPDNAFACANRKEFAAPLEIRSGAKAYCRYHSILQGVCYVAVLMDFGIGAKRNLAMFTEVEASARHDRSGAERF
jgi:hypothetical protein